ncbi:class I SAM-dependent methyltransferase [Chlamydia psittaci]|uniref:class I SAM-dependent methyltransferase n=1 Tax=Chlamydia psittaci TaxID=83554 RepID=UPI0001F35FCD|nr:class I SAM-dependent methyltransferase [Chlamydia psittaci]AFS19219.1 TRNA/rRNA methyltransferase [Chlamydia psittaci 84/55]EPJ16045.1 putative 95 family protein [Chlamydia psittaci 02DC18]EPJ17151.1 putative 95 family protein [Chlamydia psittaci 02DC22]EPJ19903.1 putative 95 family protein [Chlamydia psittaci 02DC23]EPJ21002.1 putative 95 family protein [Chlamydia psittaci 02DC21]EPJ24073.1 putative 95 family protein [Chlamydia psittaci 03DC29]EPJ99092.1 putative 95 family protein [Chla
MTYKLLDSGEGKKLESFGPITLIRPSCTAIWPKTTPSLWKKAHAEYVRSGEEGQWRCAASIPESWRINLDIVDCTLKLTSFGHIGIFPEHSGFWPELKLSIERHSSCRVLNLFAYTGSTSIFAAKCGAKVCHVDASKPAIKWAQKNVENNALPEKRIFWVVEDVFSFLQKEIRKGKKYDIILLDPPTYGRGLNGEIFKIDRDFFSLLVLCSKLLSDSSSYVLITSHTPGHTPAFLQSLAIRAFALDKQFWSSGESFCGSGDQALPSGVFAKWSL